MIREIHFYRSHQRFIASVALKRVAITPSDTSVPVPQLLL
jgi:hypothetical protein